MLDLTNPYPQLPASGLYVVAEASHAPKRAESAWAAGHAQAATGIMAADCVFCLNPVDMAGLAPLIRDPGRLVQLPDRKSPRLNSSHQRASRMPSYALKKIQHNTQPTTKHPSPHT